MSPQRWQWLLRGGNFIDKEGGIVEYTVPSWVQSEPTGDVYYCGRGIYRVQYEDHDLLVNLYGVVWRAYPVERIPQVEEVIAPTLVLSRFGPSIILGLITLLIIAISILLLYRNVRRNSYRSSAQRWLDMISEREGAEVEVLENIGDPDHPIWVPIKRKE